MLLHHVEVLFEDGESVVVFLFGTIGSVVLADEVNESSLSVSDLGGTQEVGSSLRSAHVQEGKCGNSASYSDGGKNFCSHMVLDL